MERRFFLLVTVLLVCSFLHAHQLPKPGKLEFKKIPGKNIIYVVHKGNEHIASSFAKLVSYYLKEETPFKVIFPQMTIKVSDSDTWVAIAYTGEAYESGDVKLGKIPAGIMASKIYKGSYEKIGKAIQDVFREILATKKYVPKKGEPLRLLYWNSPDDNYPQDLITEIQIPVMKLPK